MSSFVANASPVKPAEPIKSGTFWPEVDLAELRAVVRITGDITQERLRAEAINSVIDVNDELQHWAGLQTSTGFATMDAVPAQLIDGKSRLVQRYLRAVYCSTAVKIAERFRSYDATAQGNQRADDLTPSIDEMRRDVRYAISDILGHRRMTVELI